MGTRIDRKKVAMRMLSSDIESYNDLARRAGLGQNTLSRVLDSYNWSSRTLDAMARALGCKSTDLLTVDCDPKAPAPLRLATA